MSPSPAAVARIKPDCLTHRNVVCRTCGEACEPDAIRFAPAVGRASSPAIDEDACTGCGECIDICPTDAVVLKPRSIKEPL